MTTTTLDPVKAKKAASRKFYQLIIRWHFFSGLLFIPMIIVISISGCIYLFEHEYEDYMYKDLLFVEPGQQRLAASQLIAIASRQFPDLEVRSFKKPRGIARSTEIVFKQKMHHQPGQPMVMNKEKTSVFINPYTGAILGSMKSGDRLMSFMKDLHGNLLTGKVGTKFVELASCWVMMLMITGLIMWWPRGKIGIRGTLIPRLNSNKRLFWRDLHAVPAFYFSFFIIFLIVSGLPWTDVWGGAFHYVQQQTKQSAPGGFHSRELKSEYIANTPRIPVDRAFEVAAANGMSGYLQVKIPHSKTDTMAIQKQADDPAERVTIHLDQYTGKVIANSTWDKTPPLAKAVAWGIKLHRGEYFGVGNLVLVLITTLVLIMMSVTGLVMWLKRKPEQKLGAPKRPRDYATPNWVIATTVFCAVLMPVLGASLLVYMIGDYGYRKLPFKIVWKTAADWETV